MANTEVSSGPQKATKNNNLIYLIVAGGLLAFFFFPRSKDQGAIDLAMMQGEWEQVGSFDEKRGRFLISGNTIEAVEGVLLMKTVGDGYFALDASKSPKRISGTLNYADENGDPVTINFTGYYEVEPKRFRVVVYGNGKYPTGMNDRSAFTLEFKPFDINALPRATIAPKKYYSDPAPATP